MPADNITVNLLEHNELEESPIGRIITWATTYGRYIMITTEIVVLLAFISRFSLDRKLTDLNEEIQQKQSIIEANLDFEKEFRSLQDQIAKINSLIRDQNKPLVIISQLKTILPADVYFESLTINNTNVTIQAVAGTTAGFTTFLNNLQTIPQFSNVDIGEVKKTPEKGFVFQVTARLASEASKAMQQKTEEKQTENL